MANAPNHESETRHADTADLLRSVEEGDTLRVDYRSTQSDHGVDNDSVVEAEVVEVDLDHYEGYLFGEVYLAVHRDEDDTLPRRRISVSADSPSLEARRTTRQGAQWQRISQTTNCEVSLAEADSDDESDDDDDDDSEHVLADGGSEPFDEVDDIEEGSEVRVHYRADGEEREMTGTLEQHREAYKFTLSGDLGSYVVSFQAPSHEGGLRGATTGGTVGTPTAVEVIDDAGSDDDEPEARADGGSDDAAALAERLDSHGAVADADVIPDREAVMVVFEVDFYDDDEVRGHVERRIEEAGYEVETRGSIGLSRHFHAVPADGPDGDSDDDSDDDSVDEEALEAGAEAFLDEVDGEELDDEEVRTDGGLDEEVEAIAEEMGIDTSEADFSEVEEPPERVDVSDAETAREAALRTAEALREWAEFYGSEGDAEQIHVYDPEETRAKRDMRGGADCWTVSWEGGPYEWAPALTGGEWLGWNEHGGSSDPEVSGLLDGDSWGVECYYSFDLQFFDREGGR